MFIFHSKGSLLGMDWRAYGHWGLKLATPTVLEAQLVRPFASNAEGYRFLNPGRDQPMSFKNAVTVSQPNARQQVMTIRIDVTYHDRCGTLKNVRFSMAMNAEHKSQLAAFHRQWWCLQMSGKQTPDRDEKRTSVSYGLIWSTRDMHTCYRAFVSRTATFRMRGERFVKELMLRSICI